MLMLVIEATGVLIMLHLYGVFVTLRDWVLTHSKSSAVVQEHCMFFNVPLEPLVLIGSRDLEFLKGI